jgi:hypothetical protein
VLTACRVALAVAALGAIAPAGSRGGTVWTALASEKIRADAPARTQPSAAIAAARNEFEAFQVIVTGPARGVSAQISAFEGPGIISNARLYREDFVHVVSPSAADGATGLIPDALVPDVDVVVGEKRNAFPFDVPAGQSRGIWVELHVPPGASPGSYRAAVTVRAEGRDTSVPVTLRVWDFSLPSTGSIRTAFAMSYGGVVKQHGVTGEALTQLRRRYAQLALDHRVSLWNLWDDGLVMEDWSHFDTAYGPFLDGAAPTQLKGAKLTSLKSGASLSSVSEHVEWAAHFKARGWFDRLLQFTCDEPPLFCNWPDIPPRLLNAKRADPEFRTLITTDIRNAKAHGLEGSVDVLAPMINFMETRLEGNQSGVESYPDYSSFLSSSPLKELWLYQACPSFGCGGSENSTGWPSYVIDSNAVRSRAMAWLSFRHGAKGEFYYETTQAYYGEDPWVEQRAYNGTGDGTLFYPGTVARIGGQTDIPVASIRLKMVRESYEDYEYLKMLSDLGGEADARGIAQQLFAHAWGTDQSPSALMSAREALAQKILARLSKPEGGSGGCGRTAPVPVAMLALVGLLLLRVRLRRLGSRRPQKQG